MDWIGFGSAFRSSLWIGLDWLTELMDWIGFRKLTHVQLWSNYIIPIPYPTSLIIRLCDRHEP